MSHRRAVLATALLAAAVPVAACGTGDPRSEPARPRAAAPPGDYVLPGARVFPEGIAVERSTGAVFVGSTTDGTIFRAAGPGGRMERWLPGGRDGRTAVTGLEVDRRGRLFAAGRDTGRAFVYDAASGRLIRGLRAPGSGRSLVNDVAATQAAAYFTDSYRPVLYRARLDGARVGPLEPWLDLRGTAIPTGAGFGLNGIVASADGRHLVTVHFDTGRLFRIDARTRAIREVDLGGAALATGDGMVLDGRDLLVVREEPGEVVPVRLSQDLLRGRPGTPFGANRLRFPTTAAVRAGRVLVVNSQLDRAPDRGRPPFTVSALARPAP